MARIIGRVLLWGFASLGVLAVPIILFLLFLANPGDPLDSSRVVDVIPSPDGRQAAVIYLYHHANSSGDFIGVKVAGQRPFPKKGDKVERPQESVLMVTSSWNRSVETPEEEVRAKGAVAIKWNGRKLEVCPRNEYVSFHAGFFGDDNTVMLCKQER